jgi:uncharacterized repeat protein (TIGR01451 family)
MMITRSTIMRSLLAILVAACSLSSNAQTVSFSLITAPCNYNGVLGINMTGMTPPVVVTWQTTGTNAITFTHTVTGTSDAFTNYPGGPVSVFASDGMNFASNTYAGASPFNYTMATTPEVCPVKGTATVTVTGGTAPYTYQWYDKQTDGIVGTTGTVNLHTGNYGVSITDAAGCKYGSKVNDDGSDGYIYYVAPFTATVTTSPANCTNGSATVSAISSGAAMPVAYDWSNHASTQTISGLSQGTFSVWITDALGCHAGTGTPDIDQPQVVSVTQSSTIGVTVTTGSTTCAGNDGTATAIAAGGTAPYTYLWNNGATTQSQTSLNSGGYVVTVTDANGCTGQGSNSVFNPSPIMVSASSSASLCTIPSGNATISAFGGTAPYTIQWFTTPAHTGSTATSLPAGDYGYKVTDAAGCVVTGTVTVPQVNTIYAFFMANPTTCATANGSMSVTPTGGVAPYSYSWSTGASGSSISAAPAGDYTVTITDGMSCKTTVTHPLPALAATGAGIFSTPPSCEVANDGTAMAIAYGGASPYAYGWSTGGTTSTITSLHPGPYWLNVTDLTGCSIRKYTYLSADTVTDCFCSISGTIYNDTNANCTQEAGELGIANIQVYCSGIGYTYTDANGRYSFHVPSGSYTITESIEQAHPLASCQLNDISVTAIASAGCVHTVDFANAQSIVHDVHISTWDVSKPVPGSDYRQVTIVSNKGSYTEDSIVATHNISGALYTPSFVPSSAFTGTPLMYTTTPGFASLNPGAAQAVYGDFSVPANMPAGTNITVADTAAFMSPIASYLLDYTADDNIGAHSAAVVNSYVPNFKEVHPKGTGSNGTIYTKDSVLEYMIHFENTTETDIQNVTIVDTLDNNLDWTSLRPVYASAPAKVTLTQAGSYKIATFTFSNINLTTLTITDARNQGLLTYTIKTRNGLAVGTQFKNHASIYFGGNEPVITNTTLNTLGLDISNVNETPAGQQGSFVIYPNPASASFTSVITGTEAHTAQLTVCDVTGKTMITKTIALQKGTQHVGTDISQLAPGVYFVTLNNNGKNETQKLVIVK